MLKIEKISLVQLKRLMQENAGQGPFPSTIGHVTKAITFNTPHEGSLLANTKGNGCGGCQQGYELAYINIIGGSDLLKELGTSGRNPQTSAGFTEWTTIGSQCDKAVQPTSSSAGMHPSYAVVYSGTMKVGPIKGTPTCYDHGGALHDDKAEHDAPYCYCDTSNSDSNACTDQYQSSRWSKTKKGLHGLELLYTRITEGLPQFTSSAARTRPHLWMAATLATTWALMARQRI